LGDRVNYGWQQEDLGLFDLLMQVHTTIVIEHFSGYLEEMDIHKSITRKNLYWEPKKKEQIELIRATDSTIVNSFVTNTPIDTSQIGSTEVSTIQTSGIEKSSTEISPTQIDLFNVGFGQIQPTKVDSTQIIANGIADIRFVASEISNYSSVKLENLFVLK
jgi:hypothetical protein